MSPHSLEPADSILNLIGRTPVVRLSRVEHAFRLEQELYAKLELANPGGSVKDRIGLYMLLGAEKDGLIKPGAVVIEPTSGNTGIGLALAAIPRGYRLVAVMPSKMSLEKEAVLRALGARIVRTPTAVAPGDPLSYYRVAEALRNLVWRLGRPPSDPELDGLVSEVQGWVDRGERARLSRVLEEAPTPTPYAYIPNQYANKYNPLAHEETTAREIWEQMSGRLDYLFAGMGTGGTITGIARFLRRIGAKTRVVGVDPKGSIYHLVKRGVPLEEALRSARPYKVEGIGEDLIPETIDLGLVDDVVVVGDEEAFAMARFLARVEGILAGGSSGAALYSAVKYLKLYGRPGERALVILPDTGRNYLSKIYNDEWMRRNGFNTNELEVLKSLIA